MKEDFYKEKAFEYANVLMLKKLNSRGITNEEIDKSYVIYARKSTKGKDKQERSVADQIAECKEFAEKNSLKIMGILEEKETAHKSDKRPVFNEILQTIKEGNKYNSILAWHPDRLARNMKEAGMVIDMLDEGIIADLKFSSYTFVNDPSGKMALGIQFVLAKNYSDNVGTNTKRGSDRTVEEGKAMGKPKHGYEIVNKYYRPHSEYFSLIRAGWDMLLEGKTLGAIQQYWTNKGYKRLGHSTMSRIFNDPFYAGIYIHGDNVIDLTQIDKKFKPMVTFKEFIFARQFVDERKAFDPKSDIENILFKRMVKCGYCEHYMTPSKSKSHTGEQYYYIICSNESCENRKKGLKRSIRGKILLDYIIQILSNNLNVTKALYNKAISDYGKVRDTQIESTNNKINSLSNQIDILNTEIDGLTQSLPHSSTKAGKSITERIRLKSDEVADKKIELEALEQQKIKLENKINEKIISYENFSNFFQNAEQQIKKNTDTYLLDQLVRNVFSNFIVKSGKVISHELIEPFATYEKLVLSPNG